MKKIINSFIKGKKMYFICIIFLSLLVIRTIYTIYNFNFRYQHRKDDIVKEAMVIELREVYSDRVTYLVRYDRNNFLLNIYSKDKDKGINKEYTKFKYGDNLKVNGKLSIPESLNNPNEFNYKRYLNSKNIVGTISTYRVKKISEKYGIILFKPIYNFRRIVGDRIDSFFSKEKSGLLKSMIYGDSLDLDKDIKEDLQINGMSHIVSVSGTNLSYIFIMISMVFGDNKSSKDGKGRIFLNILIICCFCILASFSISILRATIMNIILILSRYYNIKLKKYTAIIVSLIVLYIYNPFVIFSASFVFSYLAVIGIVTFQKEMYSLIEVKTKRFLRYNYIEKSKIKIFLYNTSMCINRIVSVYLSVQVLTLPFQIYYFNQFSLTSIFSNLLIYPVTLIVFFLGFLSIFLMFIPFISTILFSAQSLMLTLLITISEFCTKFEFAIKIPKVSIIVILIYYIFLILFRLSKKLILFVKRKHSIYFKLLLNSLFLCYVIYIAVGYLNVLYFKDYIYFFNVKQGNMTFIRYNRKNILIDCGSTTNNLSANVLNSFCKGSAVDKIDICFFTHLHDDHINGTFNEKLDVDIEKIVYSYPKEEINNLSKLNEFVIEKNVSLISSNIFDIYEYDGLKIYILSPDINEKVKSSDIQNSNSQVILLSIKERNYLFMGDATKETEKYIISKLESLKDMDLKNDIVNKLKDLDVIQVGHHGSNTSTSEEFLNYITVKNAIISAEKKKYGHPSEEVVRSLNNKNINLFLTEKNGAIRFNI